MGTLADLAESGDADALSAAIADGAHLDEADDEGNTATHKAAQGEPECLRLLLSHGATVDSANAEGSTPLIEAVKYGDRECVAIILEAGAAMAHLDATGRSALGYAEDEVADAEIISMLGGTARAEPVEERKPANTGRRASAVVEEVMPLMQQLVLLLSKAGEPMALSRQQTAMTLYLLECVLEKMSAEGS